MIFAFSRSPHFANISINALPNETESSNLFFVMYDSTHFPCTSEFRWVQAESVLISVVWSGLHFPSVNMRWKHSRASPNMRMFTQPEIMVFQDTTFFTGIRPNIPDNMAFQETLFLSGMRWKTLDSKHESKKVKVKLLGTMPSSRNLLNVIVAILWDFPIEHLIRVLWEMRFGEDKPWKILFA
ncbi:breast cancer associated RING 1 [Striga asiatica]|uniref:Breast cancer associated RING 1 n=1 Tax=Striga asiatica TaxID=4170 RepID=A0A5A7PMR9_STRAF|nr:breast cancer associated RING 1 [Striga asiatica]